MTTETLLSSADPATLGFCPERLQHGVRAFDAEVARQRLPGAVVLVARRGKIGLHACVGRQDPAQSRPMALDSLFRIYSMTKPLVSVAALMLMERGQLALGAPVARYLPEFADVQVCDPGVAGGLRRPRIAPTVQDLLRHTAGLTYEILGDEPVQQMYAQADFVSLGYTNRAFSQAIARLPLMFEPGTTFAYSRATDVLGSLIEVVSGQTLADYLDRHILAPLGMSDTGFVVPSAAHHRIAEPFALDPDNGLPVQLTDVRRAYPMQSGGAGLVSTAADYARFLQCLLAGGVLQGQRVLAPSSVRYMTADHLDGMPQHFTQRSGYMLARGVGFGLGVSVKLFDGQDCLPGSAGLYGWSGIGGTTFFVDPAQELLAILMTQAPYQRDVYRAMFRNLVYAALLD